MILDIYLLEQFFYKACRHLEVSKTYPEISTLKLRQTKLMHYMRIDAST